MTDTFTPAPATAFGYAPQSVSYYSSPGPSTFLPAGHPAERYLQLTQKFDDLRALIPDSDLRHQAHLDRLATEARFKQLTDHRSTGGFEMNESDYEVKRITKELEAKTAERDRLNALTEKRQKGAQSCGALLSNVKSWLLDGRPRGTSLQALSEIPVPKLLKSESVPAAFNRLREQAQGLRTKLAEIEAAPVPAAVGRARAKEQLAALAARGSVNVAQLLTPAGGLIGFPETRFKMKVHNSEPAAIAIDQMPDFMALLVAAAGPALAKICDEAITATADDARALTDTERAKQLTQTAEALFAVELDQATLMFAGWERGEPIEADDKLSPGAVLATRNVVLPPTDMSAPSTAPGYTVRR